MWVDTIYDLIKDFPLCQIFHIWNVDIYGTQHNIVTKRLSVINTVSSWELSSTTKRWMWRYKESINLTHAWIKFNDSMNDMAVKRETYGKQMDSAIIQIPQFINEKNCSFILQMIDYYHFVSTITSVRTIGLLCGIWYIFRPL